MLNLWLFSTGSFLAGLLAGLFAYAAADRHLRANGPPLQRVEQVRAAPSVAAVSDKDAPPGSVTRPERGPGRDAGQRWSDVELTLSQLARRLTDVEAQLATPSLASSQTGDADLVPASANATERAGQVAVPDNSLSETTLVAAGVDPTLASDIVRRTNRLDMQRLELRDRAAREGWLDSERFGEELRLLEADSGAFREEIGDDAYDRFLHLTGQPNRVRVASVIGESPAEWAGMRAGDLVISYADSRVFSFSDLRAATRAGERGQSVVVRVLRAGEVRDLIMPRGPVGIRLESARVDPEVDAVPALSE